MTVGEVSVVDVSFGDRSVGDITIGNKSGYQTTYIVVLHSAALAKCFVLAGSFLHQNSSKITTTKSTILCEYMSALFSNNYL